MSALICPYCGAQNGPQARFCLRCGKPLAAVGSAPQTDPAATPQASPTCPRCKSPLRTTSRFCGVCGYDLMLTFTSEDVPAPPVAAAPTPAAPPAAGAAPHPAAAPPPPAYPASPHTMLLDDSGSGLELVVGYMGGNSQRYALDKPILSVGRAPDNDIVINIPAVSGHHLRLTVGPSGVMLTDLNSTNGTQVNGQRLPAQQPHLLQSADIVRIGDLQGNWVSLNLESKGQPDLRVLSLGSLDLTKQPIVAIGRDPASYLPLNHPAVSYHHAQILKQNGGLVIRDLNSTNGTFVNGQRIAFAPLNSGDEVQIGPFQLVYDAQNMQLAQSLNMGHRIDAIKLGREVGKKRMILRNVSLTVNPGEFVAFVGGSGAGKSTLMKAMNGYEPANHGGLLLDGQPLYERLELYRTTMGYVPQDDIIHRNLPVKTALYYAAKLRLPDARPAEIRDRIADALRAVEMTEHADKPVRVLSGGQRKRVSIAAELLARPTLFFLDEPTSGLDPGLEKKMMYDLNRLADEGRTVVLVTHATANIEQCDQVAFLSLGRLSYYGPPNDALSFFGVRDFSDIYLKISQEVDPAHGKPVPPELAAYYHPQPGQPTKANAGVLWADHYAQSPQFKTYVTDRQRGLKTGQARSGALPPPSRRGKDNFLRQMIILTRRQFDLIRYDWRTLAILLLMIPLISILFAGVTTKDAFTGRPGTTSMIQFDLENEVEAKIEEWQKLPNDASRPKLEDYTEVNYLPLEDAQTLVSMLALALTQAGTFVAAYEIVKERGIYRRERAVNLSAIAYVGSKVIVLGVFALFQVLSAMLIVGITADMGVTGAIIDVGQVEMFITLYLSVMASITFGLFISAIVPSTDVVLYAILVQLFAQIILGGTLFPLDNKIASAATIAYWSTDAMGSTIDIGRLNSQSLSCVGVESYDPINNVKEYKPYCSKASTDLSIDYEHTPEHVFSRWVAIVIHALFWFLATLVVQVRKKGE